MSRATVSFAAVDALLRTARSHTTNELLPPTTRAFWNGYVEGIEDALGQAGGLAAVADFAAANPAAQASPAGNCRLEAVKVRVPYAREPQWVHADYLSSPLKEESALSAPIAEKTAKTSELVGSVSRLFAMARAVRSRSYTAIATSISRLGARFFCIDCSRVSKASVMSTSVTPGSESADRSREATP